jgi:primosomal protein N' (replication factor Y)
VGERSLFHYAVPDELAPCVHSGTLVQVPFGTREVQGVVFDAAAQPEPSLTLKPIRAVLDPRPVVTPSGVELARWISAYYDCPIAETVAAMLPPGLSRRTIYEISLVVDARIGRLTAAQRDVLASVPSGGSIALDRLTQIDPTYATAISSLVRRGILQRTARLSTAAGPRTIRYVELTGAEPNGRLGAKGQAVLAVLGHAGGALSLSELNRHVGGASAALGPLQRRGLVRVYNEAVRRDPIAHRTPQTTRPLSLSAEQADALHSITVAMEARAAETFLLFGVTGSGKTEVYLQALDAALQMGRQGIVLVPEISLTPQTMDRFAARFPERVALLHSGLSDGERLDEWERARSGTVGAVVGARSAIFSPLPDIGLIVLDEEHDASYKQDRAPRYHTRDVALRLARATGAVVILGSATPDVTTYHAALQGTYQLCRLTTRPAAAQGARARDPLTPNAYPLTPGDDGLPPVEIVDLRQELHAGNRSMFSRSLQSAIKDALHRGEQAILFLNRRGAATFVICRDCGYVVRCHNCDLPYTYHSATEELICHRCDSRTVPPDLCRRCGGWRIRYFGLGTQRVEEEAHRLFPGARLLRWDRDVIGGRHGHEHVLDRFARHQADILVGTQMVAKGLDIPNVTAVGVISADTALNLPDFRAAERTFQLLTQVAGRAGRHALPGRVVVQTYAADHFAIQAASLHDYQAFYDQEILFRAESGYPPYARLLRLVYSHEDPERCRQEAERLARQLRGALSLLRNGEVIGPAPCFIGKVAGRYLWQVLVRADDVHPVLPLIPSGWLRDVDPMSLL